VLANRAWVAFARGDVPSARSLIWESLSAVAVNDNDPRLIAEAVLLLGLLAATSGRALAAARLVGWSAASRQKLALEDDQELRELEARYIGIAAEQLADGAFAAAVAEGRGMTLDEALACAREAVGEA
jgi:hypothetical protein